MAEGELIELLSQLVVAEKSAVSLGCAEEDYILNIASQCCSVCGEQARIAATSSDRCIRLYSRRNLAYIATISGHEHPISGVQFSHGDPNLLFTSSLDGTIRCWDMREDMKVACQTYEGYAETSDRFTSFDVSCNDRVVCTGTELAKNGEDVHLIFWDCRKGDALGVYSDSHQDDITQVKFHPCRPDIMLSASTDGLVCMHDIAQPTEDDALLTTLNSESSVNVAGWCGSDDETVYCLTHTEGLFIWDSDEYNPVSEIIDIREQCKDSNPVEYMVDCFQTNGFSNSLLLAGNHRGSLQILSVDCNELKPVVNLADEHTDDVRSMHWDKSTNSLVTGGDDSMLCLWKIRTEPTIKHSNSSNKNKKMKSASGHNHKKHKTPY